MKIVGELKYGARIFIVVIWYVHDTYPKCVQYYQDRIGCNFFPEKYRHEGGVRNRIGKFFSAKKNTFCFYNPEVKTESVFLSG